MRHAPEYSPWSRRLRAVLAILFLFSTVFPGAFATAQVLLFAKPGAGVSRLPLRVASFGAPGFGELAQAINLANGNAYLAAEGLNANSIQENEQEAQGDMPSSRWMELQRQVGP
jgi:hypothetical protein